MIIDGHCPTKKFEAGGDEVLLGTVVRSITLKDDQQIGIVGPGRELNGVPHRYFETAADAYAWARYNRCLSKPVLSLECDRDCVTITLEPLLV